MPEEKDAIDCVRRQLPNPPGLPWRKTGCAVAAIKLSITAKVWPCNSALAEISAHLSKMSSVIGKIR